MNDLFERIAALRKRRTPFVLATVVVSYPPQSVRAGAHAIILADGTVEGWIGGGCIRPVILDEARDALTMGTPRLVRMNAGSGRESTRGVRDYPMTCQGEGGVEIYLEPIVPVPTLCVLGDTPVAQALKSVATAAGQSLTELPNDATAVVVATMGVGDEVALAAAAKSPAKYVGLVASRKKAQFLFDYARASGVPDEQLERVKAPAGLDLGGMSPGEIAVSILAEVVQRRYQVDSHSERSEGSTVLAERQATREGEETLRGSAPQDHGTAIDPICGMTVEKATAKHSLDVGGETFYFCCPHCKARFAKAHA